MASSGSETCVAGSKKIIVCKPYNNGFIYVLELLDAKINNSSTAATNDTIEQFGHLICFHFIIILWSRESYLLLLVITIILLLKW